MKNERKSGNKDLRCLLGSGWFADYVFMAIKGKKWGHFPQVVIFDPLF